MRIDEDLCLERLDTCDRDGRVLEWTLGIWSPIKRQVERERERERDSDQIDIIRM